MKFLFMLPIAIASMTSCAATQTTPEPIYGVQLIDTHAVFVVRSNGCTKAEDFSLELTHQSIELVRLKADNCRRKPFLKSVRLPIPDQNLGKAILNPVFLGLP